jgi:hypothetical protein
MKRNPFFVTVILISFLTASGLAANPPKGDAAADSLAYFPHWEILTPKKAGTRLYAAFYVSLLSSNSGEDSLRIFLRFLKQSGMPQDGNSIQLYQASITPMDVTMSSGTVYFELAARQTAKLVLSFKSPKDRVSFGYVEIGWINRGKDPATAKFLAWGDAITTVSGLLGSGGVRGEASITVNGGSPFEIRGIWQ